uniref:Uncharacterized protein n=1 Tax=Anguilla anguilla TaxID=7936 RepID=A0A0E9STH1_ANGAN
MWKLEKKQFFNFFKNTIIFSFFGVWMFSFPFFFLSM